MKQRLVYYSRALLTAVALLAITTGTQAADQKPNILYKAMMGRLALPPALLGEEFEFNVGP